VHLDEFDGAGDGLAKRYLVTGHPGLEVEVARGTRGGPRRRLQSGITVDSPYPFEPRPQCGRIGLDPFRRRGLGREMPIEDPDINSLSPRNVNFRFFSRRPTFGHSRT
jgi:hypothetical protein